MYVENIRDKYMIHCFLVDQISSSESSMKRFFLRKYMLGFYPKGATYIKSHITAV